MTTTEQNSNNTDPTERRIDGLTFEETVTALRLARLRVSELMEMTMGLAPGSLKPKASPDVK